MKKSHTPKDRAAFIKKRTGFLASLICSSKQEKSVRARHIISGGILDSVEKDGKLQDIFLADPVQLKSRLDKCKPTEQLSKESNKELTGLIKKYQAWRKKIQKPESAPPEKKK